MAEILFTKITYLAWNYPVFDLSCKIWPVMQFDESTAAFKEEVLTTGSGDLQVKKYFIYLLSLVTLINDSTGATDIGLTAPFIVLT